LIPQTNSLHHLQVRAAQERHHQSRASQGCHGNRGAMEDIRQGPWWRDMQFLLALAAAPLAWGLMIVWMPPGAYDLGWPVLHPWRFLTLAAVSPVLEETVFRGMIQGWMLEWPWGRKGLGTISLANLLTSLLFSALHAMAHTPLWAAAAVVPSLIFGYFRERRGGLASPIALHCLYNAGYFLLYPPLSLH
jgi:CAAX protease family protein